MRITTSALVVGATFLSLLPFSVQAADEIWYATFSGTLGDELGITYKGPDAKSPKEVVCNVATGSCKNSKLSDLPKIAGSSLYPASPDRKYGVKTLLLGAAPYHVLYDISGTKAKKMGIIPFKTPGAAIKWSADGKTVIFSGPGTSVATYNVVTKKLSQTTLAQTERPFEIYSPDGQYVSFYNYSNKAHTIVRLSDGASFSVPGTAASYLEFSEDGKWVAYAKSVNSYKTLFAAALGTTGVSGEKQVTKSTGVVEDYLFVGNVLYHMNNTEHPLSMNLFSYDPKTNTAERVSNDVSYGDYIKRVNGKLVFLKVEGTATHANVFDPATKKVTVLEGVKTGSSASGITREKVVFGKRNGILLSPQKQARNPVLFVWLHGGPERQAALGYHSYLSYAVYDELLEKMAQAGNYVLKLDYTGSSGYGETFRTSLHQKVGVVDNADVVNATNDFKKKYNVDRVVLIGNSYGGYLALRGIESNPKLFQGAVSINGVTDWYALTTRIPSSIFTPLFDGVPDNHNMPAYLDASVYTNLDKVPKSSKILVVYGTNDSTVPTWQSTDYLTYAKSKKISVDSLVLSGEEHIIRKRDSLNALCKKVESTYKVGISCGVSKASTSNNDSNED